MSLSPQQQVFVAEYMVDFNATRAAAAAKYGGPAVAGSRLLATVSVRLAIQRRIEEAHAQEGVPSAEEVVRRLNAIAWADVRELQQVRVRCCRHCHGVDHAFQWRDQAEWAEAIERALEAHEKRWKDWAKRNDGDEPKLSLPSDVGGFDFDAKLMPHASCPKCEGDGVREILLADTRFLSPGAALLYAGVKQTKDGLQVLTKDQMKAIELVMRHRGLLNDKLIHLTPGGAGVVGVEQEDLAALSDDALEGYEKAQLELTAIRDRRKKALAAPERPPQNGEITDVPDAA